MDRPILLDTCAAVWLVKGDSLAAEAEQALRRASDTGASTYVSLITAWEIGMLVSKGRLAIARDPKAFFERLLFLGLEAAELSSTILVNSSFLPASTLRDPADRIIAATARERNLRVMTRDKALLHYAAAGHLQAIAC